MVRCFLALGGNVGPVEKTFDRALGQLTALAGVTVCQKSSMYCTHPVGDASSAEFRNAAAEIETDLDARALLELLQTVETMLGRTRDVHWGPRTLDLDLILYGNEVIDLPHLRVPHPACWYRRFVLDPLAEIAREVVHPEKLISIGALRSRLLERPFRVSLTGSDANKRTGVIDALRAEFPDVEFQHGPAADSGSTTLPTLLVWLGPAETSAFGSLGFEELPLIPRLDAATLEGDPLAFVRHVLQSALGECRAVTSLQS